MAIHPLILQLRFARSEFMRGIAGVSEIDAQRRILPMNCISWNVGHLAWQEQLSWLIRGQGQILLPFIQQEFVVGAPASTPELPRVLAAWQTIVTAADPWLDTLSMEDLHRPVMVDGQPTIYSFGNAVQRMLYHYWYHTGENLAIRQMLGHTDLPEFVGDIEIEAPYQPE